MKDAAEAARERQRLDDEASDWLCEREEGLTPARAKIFEEWLSSDPRHAQAFADAERTLELLDDLPLVRDPLEERIGKVTTVPQPLQRKGWGGWLGGIAAAGLLSFAGWGFWSHYQEAKAIAADLNQPSRVALEDGSVVDMNAGSRLKLDFTEGERHVYLTQGEATFQVAHNKARPFIVTAHGVSVRAVGTAFNVRLSDKSVDVLVVEGSVQVAGEKKRSEENRLTSSLLAAGERTEVEPENKKEITVSKVPQTEIRSMLSWQDKMTVFTDVPLREMVARINRCNRAKLVLADETLGEKKVGGVISLNEPAAFIEMLKSSGEIAAENRGDEIILRKAY